MSAEPDYPDLFLRAPFGYLTTEVDGTVVHVNDTLLGWLGRDRAEVVGSDVSTLLTVGSATFAGTRQQPVLLLQDEVQEVALTLRRRDGSGLSVLANSVVQRDDAGEPTGVRMAILDSSQRREYERSLLHARRDAESSESRLRVLQNAGAAFTAAATENELCARLVDSAVEAFDAGGATVMLVDERGDLRTISGEPHEFASDGPWASGLRWSKLRGGGRVR